MQRVALPDTQASKTFASAEYLADAFADHAMHRDDLVIAVGGEAIGDIAGFVAATFNRGMRLCLVPTTLAAQADSAVGGKNAINLGLGRNLVGTIHQPVVVISDIEVACANAGRGFKAGLAEIAKHALISPSDLLGYLQGARGPIVGRDPDAVCAAATRSVEIKADIVSRDEREQGDRLFLNYGHTFAHAIELVRDTTADDQGESVALGMMAAAYLAFRQGRIPESVVDQHRQTHRRPRPAGPRRVQAPGPAAGLDAGQEVPPRHPLRRPQRPRPPGKRRHRRRRHPRAGPQRPSRPLKSKSFYRTDRA